VDRRSGWGPAVSIALALVLAACTTTPDAADTAPSPSTGATAAATAPPPDDLTASVLQYRKDAPKRVVQIKLANGSSEDYEITLLDATLPGYSTSPGQVRTSSLRAGRRVDLPRQLGRPECGRRPSGSASATVQVVYDDGGTARATVPVVDDDGLLQRLWRYECDVERVEAAVDVTLSDTWRAEGSGKDAAVVGGVTVALRPGTRSVRITDAIAGELLGVTVRTPQGEPAIPLELDADRPRAELELDVIGTRCDGHAIAEAQRLIRFSFWVSVDGDPAVVIRRSPDEEGLRTIVDALLERCGLDAG